MIKIGTSAGGQRAKAIIAFNPETNEMRSGQLDLAEDFEHYILKFDGVTSNFLGDPEGYGRIEMAYYHMFVHCHQRQCRRKRRHWFRSVNIFLSICWFSDKGEIILTEILHCSVTGIRRRWCAIERALVFGSGNKIAQFLTHNNCQSGF